MAGSFFYGGKVRAASPIFYDCTVDFFLVDRTKSSYQGSDFQYNQFHFEDNIFNGAGSIGEMFLLPCSSNPNESFTTCPFLISYNSTQLALNGGKLYVSFVVGYTTYGQSFNFVMQASQATARKTAPGFLTDPYVSRTDLNISTHSRISNVNTSLDMSYSKYNNPLIVQGFGSADTDVFPIGAGVLSYGSTSQLLELNNLENQTFYYFGSSANSWRHYYGFRYVIDVPVGGLGNDNQTSIVLDLTPSISGNFSSFAYNAYMEDSAGNFETVPLAMQRLMYICPIYVFGVSNNVYEPIEENILSILYNTNAMASYLGTLASMPSSDQIAWLNEYQRKSQDAIAKASSMAAAAHYDFSKPDINSGDLSQYINGSEVRPFTTLLSSFLSHSKILIILTVAITASIIGYIFFGKRG